MTIQSIALIVLFALEAASSVRGYTLDFKLRGPDLYVSIGSGAFPVEGVLLVFSLLPLSLDARGEAAWAAVLQGVMVVTMWSALISYGIPLPPYFGFGSIDHWTFCLCTVCTTAALLGLVGGRVKHLHKLWRRRRNRRALGLSVCSLTFAVLVLVLPYTGLISSLTSTRLEENGARSPETMPLKPLNNLGGGEGFADTEFSGILTTVTVKDLNTEARDLKLDVEVDVNSESLQKLRNKTSGTQDDAPVLILKVEGCTEAPCGSLGEIPITARQLTAPLNEGLFKTTIDLRQNSNARSFPDDVYSFSVPLSVQTVDSSTPLLTGLIVPDPEGGVATSFDWYGSIQGVGSDQRRLTSDGTYQQWPVAYGHVVTVEATRPLLQKLYVYIVALAPTVFVMILAQLLFSNARMAVSTRVAVYVGLTAALLTILPLRAVLVPASQQSDLTHVDLVLGIQIGLTATVVAAHHFRSLWRSD